jgi:hypothetical protein
VRLRWSGALAQDLPPKKPGCHAAGKKEGKCERFSGSTQSSEGLPVLGDNNVSTTQLRVEKKAFPRNHPDAVRNPNRVGLLAGINVPYIDTTVAMLS